jgi:hypothetical protein
MGALETSLGSGSAIVLESCFVRISAALNQPDRIRGLESYIPLM